MEIHRPSAAASASKSSPTSIAAMRIPHRGGPGLDRHPPSSRSNSYHSSASSHTRDSMAIPGAPIDEAPPPLPPLRYNEELDRGIDLAWSWQNTENIGGKSKLAPIKPSSSLYGGYVQGQGDTARHLSEPEEMDIDRHRRGSSVSTIRSPSHADIRTTSLSSIPSFVRRPPSPVSSSASNQR
jgi:hypothetical protein